MFKHLFLVLRILIVGLLYFPIASFALSGNDLHRAIHANQSGDVKAFVRGVLDGYLIGTIDIGLTASFEAQKRGESLNGLALSQRSSNCFKFPTPSMDDQQVFDIVRKFLASNPARRHEEGAVLVLEAVSSVFPCK